jgi:hypothetical protein
VTDANGPAFGFCIIRYTRSGQAAEVGGPSNPSSLSQRRPRCRTRSAAEDGGRRITPPPAPCAGPGAECDRPPKTAAGALLLLPLPAPSSAQDQTGRRRRRPEQYSSSRSLRRPRRRMKRATRDGGRRITPPPAPCAVPGAGCDRPPKTAAGVLSVRTCSNAEALFLLVRLAIGGRHVPSTDHPGQHDHRGDVGRHQQELRRDLDPQNRQLGRQ